MKGKNKTKIALIFDLDNTLTKTHELYYKANLDMVNLLRQQIDNFPSNLEHPELVNKIFEIDRELVKESSTPNYDKALLITRICSALGISLPTTEIKNVVNYYATKLEQFPELKEHATETLTSLKDSGCYLALISEGNLEKSELVIKHYSLDLFFNEIKLVRSKSLDDFANLSSRLKADGYNIFCVGDSIKKEIKFGNMLGLRTIWIPSQWEIYQPSSNDEEPTIQINSLAEITKILYSL